MSRPLVCMCSKQKGDWFTTKQRATCKLWYLKGFRDPRSQKSSCLSVCLSVCGTDPGAAAASAGSWPQSSSPQWLSSHSRGPAASAGRSAPSQSAPSLRHTKVKGQQQQPPQIQKQRPRLNTTATHRSMALISAEGKQSSQTFIKCI